MWLLVLATISTISARATPSHQWPGHTLSGDGTSRVTLDVFGDFQCPYTAKAWLTLVDVSRHMAASDLHVRYHMFEIVAHHNAYDAARAALATSSQPEARRVHPAPFNAVAHSLFLNQSKFFNGVTLNKTRFAVQEELYAITSAPQLGVSKADWSRAFNSEAVATEVSRAHSYAISKAVHGTPTFFVQDILIEEASSSWNATQWVTYLTNV